MNQTETPHQPNPSPKSIESRIEPDLSQFSITQLENALKHLDEI